MREIDVKTIIPVVKELCIEANYNIDKDVTTLVQKALETEESATAREILSIMLENYKLATDERMPICQDTGVAVVFLEIGQDVHLTGGDLTDAINEGVRQGYREGYLRKSIVEDPVFERKNTTDNTPALIYTEIVPGDRVKITVCPKGGGAENMSAVKMLKPADGVEGIKQFVLETVRNAGGNPCPPTIVGIGIGGGFEQSALLAKKALMIPLSQPNPDAKYADLEEELLEKINKLGVGPQGLGGSTTALAVKILSHPCHIASLPVAVNIQCHVHRHKSAIL